MTKEFMIKQMFPRVSLLPENCDIYGTEVKHFNVLWKMSVLRENDHISLYLDCQNPPRISTNPQTKISKKQWSIEAEVEFRLKSKNGKELIVKDNHIFKNEHNLNYWGWLEVIKLEQITNEFLIDGKLEVEVYVKIEKMIGIQREKLRKFDESAADVSDIIFVVQNEKFYVSRLFMASQSDYFKSLLIGPFDESTKPEIELKDIYADDFQNLLELLYNVAEIDDETVQGILHLSDMFIMPSIVEKCSEFLRLKSEKPLKEKLNLSMKYNLQNLKILCLAEIKTVADIRSVVPYNLKEMDHFVLAELFEKLLDVSRLPID